MRRKTLERITDQLVDIKRRNGLFPYPNSALSLIRMQELLQLLVPKTYARRLSAAFHPRNPLRLIRVGTKTDRKRRYGQNGQRTAQQEQINDRKTLAYKKKRQGNAAFNNRAARPDSEAVLKSIKLVACLLIFSFLNSTKESICPKSIISYGCCISTLEYLAQQKNVEPYFQKLDPREKFISGYTHFRIDVWYYFSRQIVENTKL